MHAIDRCSPNDSASAVQVRVILVVVFSGMDRSTPLRARREEIGALADALSRLLRAWPGGEPPRALKRNGLWAAFPQEHQLDAELLIAAPVRHSMIMGIRALGQRLAVLDGSRGMSIALDEALGAVAPQDRLKMEEVVDDAWCRIERHGPQ